MRSGRLRLTTLVSILNSIQEDIAQMDINYATGRKDPFPLRSQKQFFPSTGSSPLFQIMTVLHSEESSDNMEELDRSQMSMTELPGGSQELYEFSTLDASIAANAASTASEESQCNSLFTTGEDPEVSNRRRRRWQENRATSDLVPIINHIDHNEALTQRALSLGQLQSTHIVADFTLPENSLMGETNRQSSDTNTTNVGSDLIHGEINQDDPTRTVPTIAPTGTSATESVFTNVNPQRPPHYQPHQTRTEYRSPSVALRLAGRTTSIPNINPSLSITLMSSGSMPCDIEQTGTSNSENQKAAVSTVQSQEPPKPAPWSDEYAHIDIDWSMQAMDTLYAASFYDYVRDEDNIVVTGPKLARLIKDYRPKQVAKAVLWMVQGWSVHKTAKLLAMIFTDWLPDLAGCVFAIVCRDWPLKPQTTLCAAYLLHSEPPTTAALFIRSLSNGWKQENSVELISFVDEMLEWDNAYFKEFISAYSKLVYPMPEKTNASSEVDTHAAAGPLKVDCTSLGTQPNSGVSRKSQSNLTCNSPQSECDNVGSGCTIVNGSQGSTEGSPDSQSDCSTSLDLSPTNTNWGPSSASDSDHYGCSQTNLVSQRPLDPNIHGHGRRYLDLTCGAQNDTQQNQECDAAHNDEALEHKNALSSKFKFTEKTQALLSKLESKTLELEKQKKELEAMQAAIEEYETDALTHRLDCRHCIDSLPCIYLDTIRLQLSDAFDGICAWE
ncbi:hypothetical protein BASA61_009459 [Batrachochytrium salamandrivorans]|nr:hypothetical protein BASA61_009459 [Batrachochytrium salamandrivorans]KAH9273630.1 hypothetical protein BASA83_003961 [Batrachochytrium salamandrivorans]KAJ1339094.1 hypothetical protein BSLG_006232 [Batrachochytrium salamandrivorans]